MNRTSTRTALLDAKDVREWAGSVSDFSGGLETALLFEGLRQKELLIEANWPSLRAYVDAQLHDISLGNRRSPLSPKTTAASDAE
ncbi:hypothetical protein TBK1r_03490 [Stieleria magnilauensis]|uniref:Uncharacterized protein n=1 Tax=Stieleria magnilauensis TaxID=2527963 RepID=A0ABX5XI14_9BACT|nr:hypothetical protein TBK1r_03490 [Planctomycetes bacterium TBK1r]